MFPGMGNYIFCSIGKDLNSEYIHEGKSPENIY